MITIFFQAIHQFSVEWHYSSTQSYPPTLPTARCLLYKSTNIINTPSHFRMELQNICETDLVKLREALADISVSDTTIERFYLAMEGDMSETERKIRLDFEWRKKVRPDLLEVLDASDPLAPEYVRQKEAEVVESTRDREGNPLLLVRAARHDGNLKDDQFKDFMIAVVEKALKNSEKLSVIFDVHKIGWRNVDFELIRFASELFNDHYPETLSKCLILRPPRIFSFVFKISKRFLGSRTIPRIQLIESRQELEMFVEDVDLLPDDVSFVKKIPGENMTNDRCGSDEAVADGIKNM